jgi:hypothetical protein
MLSDWHKAIKIALAELADAEFSYPIGDNRLLPPKHSGEIIQLLHQLRFDGDPALVEFYSFCNGISLPDVHNGCFVHALETLTASPVRFVTGSIGGDVVTIGSTGGGELFVLRRDLKDVLFLPHGLIKDGIFDGSAARVRIVAPDFVAFLHILLKDIQAFTWNTEDYVFLS